jgi:uncharacterized membrane protein (UPF0127 family)
VSRRKDVFSWLLIVLVLGLVGVAAYFIVQPQLQPHTTLHLGDGVYTTRVASNEADRQKGLSGTYSLGDDQAMLFVYESEGKWGIWMKDMNYPIDIVWLDKDKKVIYIVKNADPSSYPYETFTPKENAKYVVELKAGSVGKKAISIGKKAVFDENNLEGFKL